MKHFLIAVSAAAFLLVTTSSFAQLLHVGVAGLSHDHAHAIMNQYKRGEVIIEGIAESDPKLIERYKKSYPLPDSIFYPSLQALLAKEKVEAVLAYGSIAEHIGVVEMCAPKKISVMVEKPLALNLQEAERIEALAKKSNIHVLTNFETTWYATNQHIFNLVNAQSVGPVRKMIVHDGHGGPKEIGCSTEFLNWLTDPAKNGGGAIIDFGCYGADLMTWIMKGKKPVSVMAITKHIKPNIYPNVDDEATIVVEYEDATGIIEASWNWPFGIKDFEVFGTDGYLHALNGSALVERKKDVTRDVQVPEPAYKDNLVYFADVLHGKIKPDGDLSSLPVNMMVVRILDAARKSALEGKKITL